LSVGDFPLPLELSSILVPFHPIDPVPPVVVSRNALALAGSTHEIGIEIIG